MVKNRDIGNPSLRRRLHGRRKGHSLSPRQKLLIEQCLPALRVRFDCQPPDNLGALFKIPVTDVWLEIGFGAGEHLLAQAMEHRDIGFIGCEPFVNGVAKLLLGIETHDLGNLLVHDDDARIVLEWMPAEVLQRVFILFPDPWPKVRHRKRRLIEPDFLSLLHRAMRPGAELRLATDIGDYARTALLALTGNSQWKWLAAKPGDWRERPTDWPATRYESKARGAGRKCYYFRFQRC